MNQTPIKFTELFKLQNLGIEKKAVSFSTTTMESDKFICVRSQNTIKIIDTASKNVTTNKISAVGAIMNPSSRVLALRTEDSLQIFNLDMKAKMKDHTMNEKIQYWTWVNPSTIAIVTTGSVYHWSMEGQQSPKRVFQIHDNLANATVISYKISKSGKWLLLTALKKEGEVMKGVMQLYSVDRNVSQPIDGHAGDFMEYRFTDGSTTTLLCMASNLPNKQKLFVMDVNQTKKFSNVQQNVPFQSGQDFPVAMQSSEKHGIIFLVTKLGILFMFDAKSGTLLFKNRITSDTIFVSTKSDCGLLGINKSGQVLSVSIDDTSIISYLTQNNKSLALQIAAYADLSGADDLYVQQFNNYLQNGNVDAAVQVAAEAPQGILRTRQTLARLQQARSPSGKSPLSTYFQSIMQRGKLNAFESVELAKIVLQKQSGVDYLEKLIVEQDKMECSEELGDMVQPYKNDLAMKVYLKSKCHPKIIDNLLRLGEWERVLAYCKRVEYEPNYVDLFRNLCNANRDAAVKFAASVYENDANSINPNTVVDIFVQHKMIKEATAFLLEILKDDQKTDAELQTRLLEINLLYSPPQVADSILGQNMYSNFDRQKVAHLCEQAGLHQRALENYGEMTDIKRVILNTQYINNDWLVQFFGEMDEENTIDCLRELLSANLRQNLNIVVQAAQKYSSELTSTKLIQLFEEFNTFEGLYYYLGAVVDFAEEEDVVFKYIEAAVRIGQLNEVERVTRELDTYDADKVKEFLKSSQLKDQMPLINVCDKNDYVEELVHYLYSNKLHQYIDIYVKTRNPLKTPQVVGALLDVDASEEYVTNLLMSIGKLCPVEPLVVEVEKRNRLKLLLQWLEERIQEDGTEDPAAHNAVAKIYIDSNRNPQQFLKENSFYDSRVVGKYCEKRDPHLAYIAYERGECDEELVEVCVANSMFKPLARYLVRRQSPELWSYVLNTENTYRDLLIDQVVQTALPECKDAEEVSSTVKAFMNAEIPNRLIELLEQIVLQGNSEFKKHKSLQNLLILTAIKSDKSRVMGYIEKLNEYEGPNIALIAIKEELYEEAYYIYNKFELFDKAIVVLISNIGDVDRATEYAANVDTPEVYSILGNSQLRTNPPYVKEAIASFMKANDTSSYRIVITAAEAAGEFEDLITFLLLARKQTQDTYIDTELVYSYAKYAAQFEDSHALADLEDFISGPNTAQLLSVGERCFAEELFEAAKIIFTNLSNYSRLASALVALKQYREAVSAANKANSIKTWKEVMYACIDANDFRYAQSCGLNIILNADELDDLIFYYESRGYTDELIELLEKGLGHERAHKGIFTNLGVLYAKYREERLMEHIQRYSRRCLFPKLIQACTENHLWAEQCFLHRQNEEYDLAIRVMMDYAPIAYEHNVFIETIVEVGNNELYYKAISFYLEYQPQKISDLLLTLSQKDLDHERVAREYMKDNDLPLLKKYFENVQELDLPAVNEALNKLYVEEEDYESLRTSLERFGNFNQIALAKSLENHELLEFRRISALVYRQNSKFLESIALSKKDKLYKDAMETAAESQDRELAEDLLKFFIKEDLPECFASCLFNCYSLIRPDVALELAWRNNHMDMAMPFLIQVIRQFQTKMESLSAVSAPAAVDETQSEISTTTSSYPEAHYAPQYPPHAFPPMVGSHDMMMPPQDHMNMPPSNDGGFINF